MFEVAPVERPYRTDRYGFPVETCDRCGGAGTIPGFGHVQNGVCFGCNGARVLHPKGKVAKLAAEFYATLKTASRCTPATFVQVDAAGVRTVEPGVQPGEHIRQGNTEPWREVATVRTGRRVVGEGWVGAAPNARLHGLTLETTIVFTDGSTARCWSGTWRRRPDVEALTALRDRLAGQARTVYETTMARRTRRAAK